MNTQNFKRFSVAALVAVGILPSLQAQPGSGIRLGDQTVLVPELSGSYNYDSNVNLRRRAVDDGGEDLTEAVSDEFWSYEARLRLTRLVGNRRLTATGWYGEDTYNEFSELDGENYGGSAGYFWSRPGGETSISATASYEYAVDRSGKEGSEFNEALGAPEVESIAERVERDIIKANIKLDQKLVNDLGSAFIFAYDDTQYVQDQYFDRTGYDYIVELNYQLSDKSQPYGRLGYGIDQDEAFVDDAEKPFFLLGTRYTATDKLSFDVAIGYEKYTRTPLTSVDPDNPDQYLELEDSGTKYTLNVNYQATPKSFLRLTGRNGYDSASSASTSSRRENSVTFQFRHQTTRRINQSFLISWREDDYLSPITIGGVEYDELKETLRYQYLFDYQTVRPWLSLFANASYEDGSSNLPNDAYDQTEISLGAKLRY